MVVMQADLIILVAAAAQAQLEPVAPIYHMVAQVFNIPT